MGGSGGRATGWTAMAAVLSVFLLSMLKPRGGAAGGAQVGGSFAAGGPQGAGAKGTVIGLAS